jgi:glucose/arabinose dehydrogenase
MKRNLLTSAIILFAVSLLAAQQKNTTDVPIRGIVYEPATLAPTVARIKTLKVPPGFQVAKFAEISGPRILAVHRSGTVYVSNRNAGTLTMLGDTNGDGVADVQKIVAEKKMMHGVWVESDEIYLVDVKNVHRARINNDGTLGELRTIIDDLPDGGQHPNRTLAVRDGKLYISVGSTCNACMETTNEAATMLVTDLDGKNRRIYAEGLRNTIGFGWHPVSRKFYGMDHGIDWLGDDDQREELNEIVEGSKYGWPYAYADGKLNPQDEPPPTVGLTNQDWANQSKNPLLLYTAHAAPMQMIFYTGSMFPAEYRNDAFVTMRGSWNRSVPSGYEVVRVRFDQAGNPTAFEPFLTGFIVKGGSPEKKDAKFGRPVGLAQMLDGSVLFTDDTNNVIYRISHGRNLMPPIMSRDNIAMMLPETSGTAAIKVTSSSFTNMGALADKYSAYYQDVSPALQ